MPNVFDSVALNFAQLKNFYKGPIVDQFSEDMPVFELSEKVKEGWSGYQVVRPVKVRRLQAIGATSETGNLPAIGAVVTAQALISAKLNYARPGITALMIAASKNDIGAFVRGVSYEIDNAYMDLKNDVNRQLYWTGDGKLATVSANAISSVTITVTGRESTEAGNKFLDVGMVIDIISAGGTVVAQGITINGISGTTTATLTLSAPVTVSSTDFLVRSGSYNNEINGLLYTYDGGTSTIYNINRATYPQFQGNVVSASSGQLTLDLLQQAYNEGLRRGGKASATYSRILCDYDSLRFYQKLVTADKRYVNTLAMDAGAAQKGKFLLEFNACPIQPDKDSPRRFFFLPEGIIKHYVLQDVMIADESGSELIPQTSSDLFEMRVRLFSNLFVEKPSAGAVLSTYISP